MIAAKELIAQRTEEKTNLQNDWDTEKRETNKKMVALHQDLINVTRERDKNEQDLQAEIGMYRKAAAASDETNKRNGVLQAALDGAQNDLKVTVADRNRLQKELVDKTDECSNANNERQRLVKLDGELAATVIKLRETLNYYKLAIDDWKIPPPDTPGEVTAILGRDVVEISLGADDGVRKGHKFVVTRPGKYVGIIVVTQVDWPNRAVCRPDTPSLSSQIQKGDHVKAYTIAH